MSEVTMAKKKGRPAGTTRVTRTYSTIKIDRSLMGMLKAVATRRGTSVADLASDIVRPIIEKEYVSMLREDERSKEEG
jgi:hypothetical protein